VAGSGIAYYVHRNVSPSLGFALGWLYFYSLGILVPYEITAAGLLIDYWESPVNIAVWITILIIIIVGLNFMPVSIYGETEFWFAGLKILMVAGFFILTFVLFWGGGPLSDGILGFHYWKSPGATNTFLAEGDTGRWWAFLEVLILSSFPYIFSPELVIATGGEMKNPRRNLPKSGTSMFNRLVFFYVGTILAISIICPHDAAGLVDSSGGSKTSALVIGIKNAGITALPSVVNAGMSLLYPRCSKPY
jgi:amino acid transporter